MTRKDVLTQAEQCVCRDRESEYGSPEDNFRTIAVMWTDYIYGKRLAIKDDHGVPVAFTPHDVSIMMALLKIGRIASGQTKDDNYIDLAGYAACAGEIATKSHDGV